MITKSGLVYSCGDLVVAPYPTERLLAMSYYRFEDEDLLDIVFHERTPSLSEFLAEFTKPGRTVLTFAVEDGGTLHPAGFGWINETKNLCGKLRWAETGAGVFREYQHRKYTIPFIRMACEYSFSELKLDAIHGITPEPNRAMIRLLRVLGFEVSTPIALMTLWKGDTPCGAHISTMTAERWRAYGWSDQSREERGERISGGNAATDPGGAGTTD